MKELEIGKLYFVIQYPDDDLLFLMPTALVFLGQNLDGDETEDLWYFQNPESYCDDIDAEEETADDADSEPEGMITAFSADQLDHVVDFDGLATVLADCKSRWGSGRH